MGAYSSHKLINTSTLRLGYTHQTKRRLAFAIDFISRLIKNCSHFIQFCQKAGKILFQATKVIFQATKHIFKVRKHIFKARKNIFEARKYISQARQYIVEGRKYIVEGRKYIAERRKCIFQARKVFFQLTDLRLNAFNEIIWTECVILELIKVNIYAKHFYCLQNNNFKRLNDEKGAFF